MLLAFDSTFLFADAERKVHLFSLGIRASAHVICSTYIYILQKFQSLPRGRAHAHVLISHCISHSEKKQNNNEYENPFKNKHVYVLGSEIKIYKHL